MSTYLSTAFLNALVSVYSQLTASCKLTYIWFLTWIKYILASNLEFLSLLFRRKNIKVRGKKTWLFRGADVKETSLSNHVIKSKSIRGKLECQSRGRSTLFKLGKKILIPAASISYRVFSYITSSALRL